MDTNVLMVANGSHGGVSPECQAASARALEMIASSGHLFVDDNRRVINEYVQNLNPGQPKVGNRFVKWLLRNEWNTRYVTQVRITDTPGGPTEFSELPPPAAGVSYDLSDQKFLAIAAAEPTHPPILQSFDSKWWGWQKSLRGCGVTLHFLCAAEIEVKFKEKHS